MNDEQQTRAFRLGFLRAWYSFFGKPDGWLIRFRCWLGGHVWETCHEECCEGAKAWCLLCATYRNVGTPDPYHCEVRDG